MLPSGRVTVFAGAFVSADSSSSTSTIRAIDSPDIVSITYIIASIISCMSIWKPYVSIEDISPTPRELPALVIISFEPTIRINAILKYTHICIRGEFSATILSALVKSLQISPAAMPNFFFS